MAKVVISEGLPVIDGEYELDASYFTNRELHLIKREANVRAGEVTEALEARDNDVFVVLAYIALQRAGKGDIPIDALWDMEAGKITFDFSDEEQEIDALPPEIVPVSSENRNGPTDPSSEVLSGDGEVSLEPIHLSATGDLG
jgi:hypothetical protein